MIAPRVGRPGTASRSDLRLLVLVKYCSKCKGRPIPWTVLLPVFTILLGYLSDTGRLGGIILPTLKETWQGCHERRGSRGRLLVTAWLLVELPDSCAASHRAEDKYGTLQARIVAPPTEPLSNFPTFDLLRTAFGVAFVAVLETLISAKIAEQRMCLDSSIGSFERVGSIMPPLRLTELQMVYQVFQRGPC